MQRGIQRCIAFEADSCSNSFAEKSAGGEVGALNWEKVLQANIMVLIVINSKGEPELS